MSGTCRLECRLLERNDGDHVGLTHRGRDLTRTLPEFGNSPAPVHARAMMQFDQNFAWLERNLLTVLLPDGSSRQFAFDRRTQSLAPATTTDHEAVRQALANVLMPAWLYREQRYRTAN